ncbi:hypothetical protein ACFXOQ_36910, partial [Streptomyces californicus]
MPTAHTTGPRTIATEPVGQQRWTTDPSRPIATNTGYYGGVPESDIVTARNPQPLRSPKRARKFLFPGLIALLVAALVGTG